MQKTLENMLYELSLTSVQQSEPLGAAVEPVSADAITPAPPPTMVVDAEEMERLARAMDAVDERICFLPSFLSHHTVISATVINSHCVSYQQQQPE